MLALVLGVLAGTDGGHQDWRSLHLHQALGGTGAPQAGLAGEVRQGQGRGLAPGLLSFLAGQAVLGPSRGGETDFSLELHQTVTVTVDCATEGGH